MGLEERDVLIAWGRRAKGKGLKWRHLRDLIACACFEWMNSYQLEFCMRRLHGITPKKTREMMHYLETDRDLDHEKHERTGENMFHASQKAVSFWVDSTKAIPAGIVQVVQSSSFAKQFEDDLTTPR